jgi:hypothetical protein
MRPDARSRTMLPMNRRLAPLLGLGAIGCSLLVPLDYTGGIEESPNNKAGRGGDGAAGSAAFSGDGGSMSEGGTGDGGAPEGGADSGATGGVGGATGGVGAMGGTGGDGGDGGQAGDGGMDGSGGANGGMSGTGGASGGEGATAGQGGGGLGGVSGGGQGGSGGRTGGTGGTSGSGGRSAGTGGTAGNDACPGADFMTDEMHCGNCTTECPTGVECLGGVCVSSPCEGLCATWTGLPLAPGDGYRKENVGNGESCFEVTGYNPAPAMPKVTCWELIDGRTFEINGQSISCPQVDPGASITAPQRGGGYCVHVGAGEEEFGGFRIIRTM